MAKRPETSDEGAALRAVPDDELQLRKEAQDMGWVGKCFGSTTNAALYFAALLMILGMLFLGILAVVDPSMRADAAKVFGAAIIGALGFIGGLLKGRSS